MPTEPDLPPTLDGTSPAPAAPAPGPTAPPGYEILGELGRGGMSVVWRARDRRLGRDVALKFLLGGDAARLRAEAAALARLQHPHIVQVFEIGDHQGRSFLALEFCPGGTLEDRLTTGPLPPREAAELVLTLAGAVQAAHAARVLHRDLKPANVLLAGAIPKVADFGLARELDVASQTATGAIAGTPSYMAPEQARGEKALGPACDVYALGAILYACLTGRPPFRAATTMDTLWQVLHQEPVLVRQLNPSVPRDLETICLKCLGKDPNRRYASAAALADDLARFLAGRPILARPAGWAERAYRWVRRNPVVSALAALVVLVLATGILIASAYAVQAGDEARRASLATIAAGREADDAKAARREAEAQLHRARLARYGQLLEQVHRTADPELLATADWDLRGPEFRYLNALLHHVGRRALPPAPGNVLHAGWSPDGSRIVYASQAGMAQVLDAATGRPLLRLDVGDKVSWAEFRPDGRAIATASADKTVRLWDATTGRETRAWKLDDPGKVAAWSPDGKVVAGLDEKGVRVWDAVTGAERYRLDGGGHTMTAVAWDPDGKRLAVGGGMGIRMYDAATGKAVPGWDANTGHVRAVAWSDAGGALAVAFSSYGLRFYAPDTGRLLPWSPPGEYDTVAWAPDGVRLAASGGGFVDVIDAHGEVRLHRIPGAYLVDGSPGAAWSPDGRTLLAVRGPVLTLLDVTAGLGPADQLPSRAGFSRVAWSPDGALLAGALDGNGLDLRAFDGREARSLAGFPSELPARDAAFHPQGTQLAVALGGERDAVLIRDLATGAERTLIAKDPYAVAWCPDGTRLAVGGGDGVVRVFHAAAGFEEHRLEGHRGVVRAVAWSPEARHVASGGDDFIVRVWDADAGKPAGALKGHAGRVQHLAWDPKGDRLASGSFDGTARVWEVATRREVLALRTGDPPTTSVDWSRDGRLLLAAGHLNLHVWETTAGQLLVRLECERHRHRANIWSAAFHPSGEWIVYGDGEGRLRLWPWDGPAERERGLWGTGWFLTGVAFARGGRRLVAQDDNGAIVVWDARTGQPLPRDDEPDELPKAREARDPATGLRAVIDGFDVRVHLPGAAAGPPRDLSRRMPPALWHHLQAEHWSRAAAPFAAAFHRARQVECDPFEAAAREELEDGLKRLGDDSAVVALRQRWQAFQAARAAGWLGLTTRGPWSALPPP